MISMQIKAKNPAAVELGRLGGKARAAALTAARRTEISRLAVMSRQIHKGWPRGKKRTLADSNALSAHQD